MWAGLDSKILRRCRQLLAVASISAFFYAIIIFKLQEVIDEMEAKEIYTRLELSTRPIKTPPVSPEVQRKILRVINCDALMKDMEEPRPLFQFILEPTKKIDATKKESGNVRWTAVNVIKSAITNRDRRDAIRETWGGVHLWKGVQITTIFILGNTSNKALQENVEQEFRKFGDILQANVEEDYKLVSYKTLAGMQWAGEVLPSNWLYSSGDDDIAFHVANFVRFIERATNQTENDQGLHKIMEFMPIICVYSYSTADRPTRSKSSKWYIPRERYPPSYWPPYCRGGWYSIPVATVARLYSASRYTPFLRLDDVWITGLIRIKMLAALEEIEEKYILKAAIIPAPLSTRNTRQLYLNYGDDSFSEVLVTHLWGNIQGRRVNVTRSLRDTWVKWKDHEITLKREDHSLSSLQVITRPV